MSGTIFWVVCTGLAVAVLLIYLMAQSRRKKKAIWKPEMVIDPSPAKRQILADCMNSGQMLIGQCDEKGNLFYEKGVSMNKEIVPMEPQDKALLCNMQGATMRGCTLPSGFKLPDAGPGYAWKIVGDRFVLTEQNEQNTE